MPIQTITQRTESSGLEKTIETLGIASGNEASCLTIIENPLVAGQIGFLFASSKGEKGSDVIYLDVHHIRAQGNAITYRKQYGSVKGEVFKEPNSKRLLRQMLAPEGSVLPNPSLNPYYTFYTTSEQHKVFIDTLTHENSKVNALGMDMLRDFFLPFPMVGYSNGMFILPRGYADYTGGK